MLSITTLMGAQQVFTNMLSPSFNPCMKRVAAHRFRHEPYNARVLPFTATSLMTAIVQSPAARKMMATRSPAKTSTPVPFTATTTAVPMAPQPMLTASPSKKQTMLVTSATPRYAVVQFKHSSFTFLAPFRIAVNDTVVVDGDRGEDIGIVRSITIDAPLEPITNKIVRRATENDFAALYAQREKEEATVRTIQQLAETVRLNAAVEDAEYQFDMKKLTVFVRRATKSTFVDFRKLQRVLFREFRCRIWCAYMDEIEN